MPVVDIARRFVPVIVRLSTGRLCVVVLRLRARFQIFNVRSGHLPIVLLKEHDRWPQQFDDAIRPGEFRSEFGVDAVDCFRQRVLAAHDECVDGGLPVSAMFIVMLPLALGCTRLISLGQSECIMQLSDFLLSLW